jgi:hypothetical protein
VGLVLTHWVGKQFDYFRGKASSEHEKAEHRHHLVAAILWCAFALAFALLLGLLSCPFLQHLENAAWFDTSIIVLDVLVTAGALVHHYNERMAHSEHAKQYSRMEKIFSYASTGITEATKDNNYAKAQTIIKELGRQALAETGDWVLLHRERPLELPPP